MGRRQRQSKRSWQTWLMLLIIPFAWVGQSQVKAKLREPQAILVLGGAAEREHFAADFARQHPDLEVWVSSGTNPEYAQWLFQEADIASNRVHLDYRAVDTVTNFTTVVEDLKQDGVESVYLVTSDYHMRRAAIIAQIVLGRHDIAFQPISVPSGESQSEPLVRGIRDGARAVFWVFTGQTGSSWREMLSKR
ncbi:YdcF family protein [Oscillatoria sp. CS-180]|uniref:YdcF family protein n=1 Tax=Oscillatoria sp. CS-180 TaxID=3021720 RepID=UPI00232AF4CE|nr:YdcF family protein [Oscillatoria sp. CS-180]MDB9526795.1 YdcF family protein [Oscillatoria sp. CS-180]